MWGIRCSPPHHSAHQEAVFLAINLVVARFVNFTTCCHLQDRHFHWGSLGFVSRRLAEAWLSAPRPACPTHSAATPGGQPPQKTMNLYHRNVPLLFGERGQNLGRTPASPAVPTRRSRSLTQKWTINRTLRWVSKAHFPSFYVQILICLQLVWLAHLLEPRLGRKSSCSRLDHGWSCRKAADWWKEVEVRLVGRPGY